MKYGPLGKTGLNVSRLSFGASALGGVYGEVDEAEGIRAVHTALDLGINYFDVAPAYGGTAAETVLGKALKGISRDRYHLSTKVGKYTQPGGYGSDTLDYSRARIRASLDESAARLGTDYFEIIHLHDFEYQQRRHTEWALSEGLEALAELKREGRIGNVSCGIYPMDLWHRIFKTLPVDAALIHNHYALSDTRALELLPLAKQNGIGIINASPFASGLLSGREAPAWHPASETDRQWFRQAAALCESRGVPIGKLALQFSTQNTEFPTTMFSSSRSESVRRNVAWHEEPYDPSLLADVQQLLAPVQNKQWDYDQGVAEMSNEETIAKGKNSLCPTPAPNEFIMQKIHPILMIATLAFGATSQLASSASLPVPPRGFVSSQPAKIWEEGLLSGNGVIGINVLSRPTNERIIFTHERLFMPMGAPIMPPDQSARLFEIRQLIDRGLYKQATGLQFNLSGQESFKYPDNFVPAFDLAISSPNQGEVRDYSRSVDFQTGETAVRWSDDRGTFERRMFVSRADGVAVLAITGSKPGSLNCQLGLEAREVSNEFNSDSDVAKSSDAAFKEYVTNIQSTATGNSLTYRNDYPKSYPGSIHLLEGFARVIATGGTTEAQPNGTLVVKDADRLLIFVDLRPVYDPDSPEMKSMEVALAKLPDDYARLLQRHAKLHGELFNRMRLDLGGGAEHQRTTEELIAESTYEKPNPALIEKEFDAGRYNIISSTGKLPPNLQGIWGGTYVPGWASDYTHNGNVPSAIAANLMGNMPELTLAYTTYIESLVPWLEINAKHMFGARGIVLPSRTSTHGFNNALAPNFAGGFWVGGAGWAAHFFYDYYLYTGDRKFLAEHALPFMEKAALFFEDYLYEGPDGKWVFSPTQSPENTPGNSKSQGSYNATMDVAVAKELLLTTIAASRELGRNQDKIPHWQQMLAKMPDYQVDERGIIKEWLTPRLENNDSHRHSSQLYPLYDGLPDEIARSPELRAAFKKSIAFKLDNYWMNNQRGFMSFGLVQLGQAATSLGDSELAYRCLTQLVNRYWLNNLASMHNHRSLLNMDISGGMPSVIIKMLVASDPGKLQLLPALPKAWPTGTIEGVLCRGQIEIKRLHWTPEGLECTLRSGKAQTVTLELPAVASKLTVEGEGAKATKAGSPNQHQLTLPVDREVTLTISCKL